MKLYDYLKNILLLLIFIYIAPSLIKGIRTHYTHLFEPRTPIGMIKIKGILYDSSTYIKQLHTFFKNPDIKGIVIKMDCFCGAAGTAQTIFNEIQHLKKEYQKPIVTLVENVCTSGGYLIATATDYIIAPDSALIGSIGSYFSILQLKDFIEHYNIYYTTISAGTYKTVSDPFTKLTEKEKIHLQDIQNNVYQRLIKTIATTRKLSLATVSNWADGKIFTGNQAHKIGLIDEIGSLSNAITILKKRTFIDGKIKWITKFKQKGLFDVLINTNNVSLFNAIFGKVYAMMESKIVRLNF